jgi:hypothetical protein
VAAHVATSISAFTSSLISSSGFRNGRDTELDLPLAPWEAVLGST